MINNTLNNKKKGFTLIELLIVIAIIAIISTIIFIALNPLQRFQNARNSQRWQDVEAIADAVRFYQIDNNGQTPSGLDENWRMLGTDAVACDVSCGSGGANGISSFTDDSKTLFDLGSYSDTQWDNTNAWLELTTSGQNNGSGTYISSIKDASSNTTWSTLSWVPERPSGKALPNNGSSESAYSSGNANMNGNVLLMHLDESSGTIHDSSGQANNGTNNGASYGVSGKFNTAMDFDGSNDYIDCGNSNSLDIGHGTWEAWIYPTSFSDHQYHTVVSKYYASAYWFGLYQNGGRIQLWVAGGAHQSTGTVALNRWSHIVVTWDGSVIKYYINGNFDSQNTGVTGSPATNNYNAQIGADPQSSNYRFTGKLDEIAIFNRVLSATEILDIYKRGALRLKYQVRSCDDNACSGESFIGPDGTNTTFYSEINNTSLGLPSFNLSNVNPNQYFQYRIVFETDNSTYTPEVNSVTTENNSSGGVNLESSCLDLSSDLADKLPKIPEDPSSGSENKTYYAIRRQNSGIIDVVSCSAENNASIKVSR